MLRTVIKQLFNYTLWSLKAYIPNPKGYTHKIRFACDRNLNDKIKFKTRKKKRKIDQEGKKCIKYNWCQAKKKIYGNFRDQMPAALNFILLPWCNIFYLDVILLPWCNIFYLDIMLRQLKDIKIENVPLRAVKRNPSRKCPITVAKWYQGRKCCITAVTRYQGTKCSITVVKW